MRRLLLFLAALPLLSGAFVLAPLPTAASTSSFSFNWATAPAAPQPWVPGQVNDWDLFSNIDGPTDSNGSMDAGHGADCSAPPTTHHIVSLADSTFICKNHMMTAVYGGGDAYVSYGAIYFAPAQLVDWSQGPSSVSWKVSTQRLSTRDWWQVNLTPFAQNMVMPLPDFFPAYQGQPLTGLELRTDNGICTHAPLGTIIRVSTISGSKTNEITQGSPCVEDAASPSAQSRSQFQIDLSANHLKVFMPGTNVVWYDGPVDLPFNKAVLQFSHHSYNPLKGESPTGGQPAPNTFHWSDIGISSATPFTMLRPQQPASLHDGQDPALTLPQPAPQNAFLRFAGLGNFDVSFDGGRSYQPARVQGANRSPEHFVSFWTPAPAGTTQVLIRGRNNRLGQPWWVQDLSVWAEHYTAPAPAEQPSPRASAGVPANEAAGSTPGTPSIQPASPGKSKGHTGVLASANSVRAHWQPWYLALLLLPVAAALIVVLWRRRKPGGPEPAPTSEHDP